MGEVGRLADLKGRRPEEHPLTTPDPQAETRQLHWGDSQTYRDIWVKATPHTLLSLAVFPKLSQQHERIFPFPWHFEP